MTPDVARQLAQTIVTLLLLWMLGLVVVQIAGRIALGIVRYFELRQIRRDFEQMLDNEEADAGFLIEYHALQRETRPGVHLDRGLLIDAVYADMRAYRRNARPRRGPLHINLRLPDGRVLAQVVAGEDKRYIA